MIDPTSISNLLDGELNCKLSNDTKESCQKVSDYFSELIHKNEENVFNVMAEEKNKCLADTLKISIPGAGVCNKIEKIRQGLFEGIEKEKITELYFDTIKDTFKYLDFIKVNNKIPVEDALKATLAFYETYGIHCFKIDEKLYNEVKNGNSSAYKAFYIEYLDMYRKNMLKIMDISSFGAERNYEDAYRKTTYKYIEMLLCNVITNLYAYEFASDSFISFTNRLNDEILNDSEAFYKLWLEVNNKIIDGVYEKEEFANSLFESANIFNELITQSKKLYEINLEYAPIAKESDMRELYKTIYELRKELDEVKKELREVKKC